MKKVLFLTNIASPYRVRFFDELAKQMEVTVLFTDRNEAHKNRSAQWFERGAGNFRWIYLEKRAGSLGGESLCWDVTKWLSREYDAIVLCGYANPTNMLAMAWLRLRGIPFYMEIDGGLIREDSGVMHRLKWALVRSANEWIGSGKYPGEYLAHYGAKPEKIHTYPFSSLTEADILDRPVSPREKEELRRELGIREQKMILSIGQFIPRKGFDVLLQAVKSLAPDIGVYIVGGEPTEEYIQLRKGLENVHFVGFQKKEALSRYYCAADLFVLPTREDIWGLVINEAMAYGLPVITTDRCVAGLELVEDGVNGYLVPVEDADTLAKRIQQALSGDLQAMGRASLKKIRPYTIENMARVHWDIFENRS